MVRIFIWAARLPAVAVGLYAVLASLVPLLSLPRPNLGAGAGYSMLPRGYGHPFPTGGGLTALPAAVFWRPFRARVGIPPLIAFAAEW